MLMPIESLLKYYNVKNQISVGKVMPNLQQYNKQLAVTQKSYSTLIVGSSQTHPAWFGFTDVVKFL